MAQDQTTKQDPTTQFPQPEQPEQQLEHPGLESDMTPKPDYGEDSYRGSGRLEGRKALITGGDSGIGRAVALAFAREGADVVITHLPEEESDATQTLAVVKDAGRKGLALAGDLTDASFCTEIVERTVAELGGIDILVNNVAFQMSHEGLDDLSDEEIVRTFNTNIISFFRTTKAALKHMEPGSAIINTASEQAFQPSPNLLAYAATKGAIVNFTKNLGQLLIEQGIRVNGVAPGPVWTPLIPATMPPDKVASFGEQAPIKRAAQPVELSPAYVFLASQESSYIAGETIKVLGGTPA
ncbi:SDR family oxidoreductase [Solirubrobacter sp. CPCC 204708]|uniref:SDR family oxidoreductase n=1 Tax=Solirubrobacter deserti TaxID=2282478 RepID=A0ABT4RDY4_9ACTN|nr:SDR family oxidoreductase [Solirubrobacter deserti]MBE2315990.1 SDR family oxidoreductase [Solirubrobacter deserti]MDA0136742.1 SDR family oxidoreductase [Solirubrobacter deserti]